MFLTSKTEITDIIVMTVPKQDLGIEFVCNIRFSAFPQCILIFLQKPRQFILLADLRISKGTYLPTAKAGNVFHLSVCSQRVGVGQIPL